jgi:two-component system cell cycle sensor histidine kinase/response regulator CckA
MSPQRIILAEDDLLRAIDLHGHLVKLGHLVCAHCDNAHDTLAAAATHRPDLAIVSANLPEGALSLCEQLRRDLNVGSVIISRHPLAQGPALDAADPAGCLVSPFSTEQLSAVISAAGARRSTELRLSEERAAARAHRLESLGRMAGGVAHDFSNLLTPILANVSSVRRRLRDDDPNALLLADAENAARRAAELCQQMLAYAGQAPMTRARVDLARLVREMHRLLRVSLPPRTVLQVRADENVPAVLCDRAQIRQAIMNLVANATEALPEGRGTVSLAVRVAEADRPGGARRVSLEVRDDGCGMSPEVHARVFEPFYSTKSTGRGLGLPATDGIVRSHGGTLEVDSVPGRGTSIRLLLPSVVGSAEHAAFVSSVTPRFVASGVAVVADDEEMIRRVARRLLTASGFDVVEAENGAEAVAHARAAGDRLAIAVLDVMMPTMDGIEAFGHIRQFTDAPVVLVSGFAEQDVRARLGELAPTAFLFKPFDGVSLLRTVEEAFRATRRG